MNLIYIGKVVNTHGLKGEIRIISDFKYKKEVFKSNNSIYINDIKYKIETYRPHKIYDMLTLDKIKSIDDALNIKGNNVYIDKNDYNFDGYLDEDLIGLKVYDKDEYKGKVVDIKKGIKYDFLVIEGKIRHLVPYIDKFVKNIDIDKKVINIKYIEGLDNEN